MKTNLVRWHCDWCGIEEVRASGDTIAFSWISAKVSVGVSQADTRDFCGLECSQNYQEAVVGAFEVAAAVWTKEFASRKTESLALE